MGVGARCQRQRRDGPTHVKNMNSAQCHVMPKIALLRLMKHYAKEAYVGTLLYPRIPIQILNLLASIWIEAVDIYGLEEQALAAVALVQRSQKGMIFGSSPVVTD